MNIFTNCLLLWITLLGAGIVTPASAEQGSPGPDPFYGMHVGRETNVSQSLPGLSDMGIRWVRLFADINTWSDPAAASNRSSAFQQAIDYKAAGYQVILEFNALNGIQPADYQQARAYWEWAVAYPGLKEAVDVWEILNELNLPKYWQGTPGKYVDEVLRPAWDVLHTGHGEPVLAGSFTAGQGTFGGTDVTAAYVAAGYLDYCDYAGVHPYLTSVSTTKDFVDRVLALFGDKPVILSEWNFKSNEGVAVNRDAWVQALAEIRDFLYQKPTVKIVCHYRLLETTSEGGWPGVMRAGAGYPPQVPFYNLFKSFPKTPDPANQPPAVALTAPATGLTMLSGETLVIAADAADADGTVAGVQFFANGNQLLGTDTDGADGWSIAWNGVPPGNYVVSVLATDNGGATRGAHNVNVTVIANTTGKVISINFAGTGSSLGPAEAAGAVVRTHWNNTSNSSTTAALLDENGANTGARVTNTLPSNYRSADPETDGDYKMMRGYVANFNGGTNSVTVADLPPVLAGSTYDVYVYWGNQDGDDDYVQFTLGGASYLIRDNTPRWNGTHTLSNAGAADSAATGANFVVFRGLTGSSFTMQVRSFGTFRAGVAGMQVVASELSPVLGKVAVTSPARGNISKDQEELTLTAGVTGFGVPVQAVSFYYGGGELIGTDADGSDGWGLKWPAPAGIYAVTAVARTQADLAVLSAPVEITVLGEAGDILSINFKGGGPDLLPSDAAGVMPAINWNNTNYTTTTPLVDANGNNTGATVSNTLPSAYASSDGTGNGDFKMMKGFVGNFNTGGRTVTVSNLPAGFAEKVYDVYVYWGNRSGAVDGRMKYEIAGTAYYLRDNSGTWNGSHVRSAATSAETAPLGASYVRFEGLRGSSFTLSVQAVTGGDFRGGISGMQIVLSNRASSSVIQPAPGTIFNEGENVTLAAEVTNFAPEAPAAEVAFYYEGNQLIGVDTDGADGWNFTWPDVPPGSYSITSVARAADGTTGTSVPVNFRVRAAPERVISVNFKGTASLLLPAEEAGAVPAGNWNNSLNNQTVTGLTDGAGSATGASVSNNFPANYQSFDAESSPDYKMMRGYVANFNGDANQVTVAGLPAGFTANGYDVYVYWGNKDTDNDAVSYALNGVTYFLRDNNEKWSGVYDRSRAATLNEARTGPSYVLFRDLKEPAFTISINSFATFRGGISGLQIVARRPTGSVSLLSPANGSTFDACRPVVLEAQTENFGAAVTGVAFYRQGAGLIGEDTDGTDGWKITWHLPDAGDYLVTAVATDATGYVATSEGAALAIMPDVTPPLLTTVAGPATLWPPDNAYRTLTAADLVAGVTDDCTGRPVSEVRITHVTSDEAEKAPGSGNTAHDMVVAPDCRSVQLRAERQGSGDGRVYTIHLAVKDAAGNVGTAAYPVQVPHNHQGEPAVAGEPAYLVEGACSTDAATRRGEMPARVETTGAVVRVYPNPARGGFTVEYLAAGAGTAELVLTDGLARPALVQSEAVKAGVNQIRVNTHALGQGLYLLTIRQGQARVVHKVTIAR